MQDAKGGGEGQGTLCYLGLHPPSQGERAAEEQEKTAD